MFSANPSISPTRLKPSDVANGIGQGERDRTGGEQGRIGRERGRTGGNGVKLGEWGWIGGIGVRLG